MNTGLDIFMLSSNPVLCVVNTVRLIISYDSYTLFSRILGHIKCDTRYGPFIYENKKVKKKKLTAYSYVTFILRASVFEISHFSNAYGMAMK